MVKANIEMPDGTKIFLEGDETEVSRIMTFLSTGKKYTEIISKMDNKKLKTKSKLGITDYLRELKEEGYFDQPKTIVEIKNELATRAIIYPVTSIQPTLTRLIKKRELGRVKQDSKWVYVKR